MHIDQTSNSSVAQSLIPVQLPLKSPGDGEVISFPCTLVGELKGVPLCRRPKRRPNGRSWFPGWGWGYPLQSRPDQANETTSTGGTASRNPGSSET